VGPRQWNGPILGWTLRERRRVRRSPRFSAKRASDAPPSGGDDLRQPFTKTGKHRASDARSFPALESTRSGPRTRFRPRWLACVVLSRPQHYFPLASLRPPPSRQVELAHLPTYPLPSRIKVWPARRALSLLGGRPVPPRRRCPEDSWCPPLLAVGWPSRVPGANLPLTFTFSLSRRCCACHPLLRS